MNTREIVNVSHAGVITILADATVEELRGALQAITEMYFDAVIKPKLPVPPPEGLKDG